ncbi:DNA repair protein RecO [filamentous cyanobacterium CCP5]|nr:DNA repair protein RecO [filamentous cyanobacterium CCP5]
MSQTYKATGINLKGMPLGESDRLLTILTPSHGLIRAVAPGARKHRSRLGGRSDLFVVNDLLIVKGKRLDKLIQADTVRSFPGLSQHLGRLTASQYLAELALFQALSDHDQQSLYLLLIEHLERIELSTPATLLPCLVQGIYHLLALAGLAPEVRYCCLTRSVLQPSLSEVDWQVGFSPEAGGLFRLDAPVATTPRRGSRRAPVTTLGAIEVALLQQLSQSELIVTAPEGVCQTTKTQQIPKSQEVWVRIERLLRQYAQYHFDRPIQSSTLMDTVGILP